MILLRWILIKKKYVLTTFVFIIVLLSNSLIWAELNLYDTDKHEIKNSSSTILETNNWNITADLEASSDTEKTDINLNINYIETRDNWNINANLKPIWKKRGPEEIFVIGGLVNISHLWARESDLWKYFTKLSIAVHSDDYICSNFTVAGYPIENFGEFLITGRYLQKPYCAFDCIREYSLGFEHLWYYSRSLLKSVKNSITYSKMPRKKCYTNRNQSPIFDILLEGSGISYSLGTCLGAEWEGHFFKGIRIDLTTGYQWRDYTPTTSIYDGNTSFLSLAVATNTSLGKLGVETTLEEDRYVIDYDLQSGPFFIGLKQECTNKIEKETILECGINVFFQKISDLASGQYWNQKSRNNSLFHNENNCCGYTDPKKTKHVGALNNDYFQIIPVHFEFIVSENLPEKVSINLEKQLIIINLKDGPYSLKKCIPNINIIELVSDYSVSLDISKFFHKTGVFYVQLAQTKESKYALISLEMIKNSNKVTLQNIKVLENLSSEQVNNIVLGKDKEPSLGKNEKNSSYFGESKIKSPRNFHVFESSLTGESIKIKTSDKRTIIDYVTNKGCVAKI